MILRKIFIYFLRVPEIGITVFGCLIDQRNSSLSSSFFESKCGRSSSKKFIPVISITRDLALFMGALLAIGILELVLLVNGRSSMWEVVIYR